MRKKLIISRISDLYDIDDYFEVDTNTEIESIRFMLGLDRELRQLGVVKPKEEYLQFLLSFIVLGWADVHIVDGYPEALAVRVENAMLYAAKQAGNVKDDMQLITYHKVGTEKELNNKIIDLKSKSDNHMDLTEGHQVFKTYMMNRHAILKKKQEEFEMMILERESKEEENPIIQ